MVKLFTRLLITKIDVGRLYFIYKNIIDLLINNKDQSDKLRI